MREHKRITTTKLTKKTVIIDLSPEKYVYLLR